MIIKVGHSADQHIDEMTGPEKNGENLRLLDTCKCLDRIVDNFIIEKVDIIILSGDLFDKAKLWSDQILQDVSIGFSFLRACAGTAPTVLIMGTENHDNPKAYQLLKQIAIPNLYIITEPELLTVSTKGGSVQVAGIPAFDRGHFLTEFPDVSPDEGNAIASKLLGDLILGLSARVDLTIPSILAPHYEIQGCERENGQISTKKGDVVIPMEAIEASRFDLVCAGHIHKAQQVKSYKPIFYCGPPTGIGFGEEGQKKGCYIHEIGDSLSENSLFEVKESRFVLTPYRNFLTVKLTQEQVEEFLKTGDLVSLDFTILQIQESIVRVYYTCTGEQAKAFNQRELETWVYNKGAFFVHSITPENIELTIVKQEISETSGIVENLESWLKGYFKTLSVQTDSEAAIVEILKVAQPLIAEASAKLPGGKLSGVFSLEEIETKNYRMHRESLLDFTKIKYAIVNGKNGTGKSSFFSDAIIDGIFEDPRSGEVGSWITNGESEGMIRVKFRLNSLWQIIRHRKKGKSGKITLSLQEWDGQQWQDRSGANKDETQLIINSLLGMDADTLRCVALIQQGRYNEFFTAKREKRMGILCAILGLGVYEVIQELADKKRAEVGREIQGLEKQAALLVDGLKGKDTITADHSKTSEEIEKLKEQIGANETELNKATELAAGIQKEIDRATFTRIQIESLTKDVIVKGEQITQQESIVIKAAEVLKLKETILTKAAEYDQLKEQLTTLTAKAPQLEVYNRQIQQLIDQIAGLESSLVRTTEKIEELEKTLGDRENITLNAALYRENQKDIEAADKKAQEFDAAELIINDLKTGLFIEENRLESERNNINSQIEQAEKKSEILNNSNCIDPDRAACNFLKDAQAAKESIPGLTEKLTELDKRPEWNRIILEIGKAKEAQTKIGYDAQGHALLKEKSRQLLPFVEQAAQLESKESLLKTYREQEANDKQTKGKAEEQRKTTEESRDALKAELEPVEGLKTKIAELETFNRLREKISAAEQALKSASDQIAIIDREITEKTNQINTLTLDLPDRDLENELDRANVDKANLSESLESDRKKLNEDSITLGRLQAALDSFQKDETELANIKDWISAYSATWDKYQTIIKACGFDGVPLSVIRGIIPEITARANYILGQMSRGTLAIEIRADKVNSSGKEVPCLDVLVNEIYSGSLSFVERSGGEQVKAGLSFAFALADVKARRIGIQTAFLFVDEPPYLDEDGAEAYCDALEWLADEHPETRIVAISHDPRMKARFNQEIILTKTENGAKLKLVA